MESNYCRSHEILVKCMSSNIIPLRLSILNNCEKIGCKFLFVFYLDPNLFSLKYLNCHLYKNSYIKATPTHKISETRPRTLSNS